MAIAEWFRRRNRLKLLNSRSFEIWSSRACWSLRAEAEGFLWSGKTGDCRASEAVIDKDRASALLASRLGVDLFVISTDTDYVYLDYKKPTQRPLQRVSAAELEEYSRAGHFPPGNMGPKIESVLHFLRKGGKEAIITSSENLCPAVAGCAGTHMFPDYDPAEVELNAELELPVGGR